MGHGIFLRIRRRMNGGGRKSKTGQPESNPEAKQWLNWEQPFDVTWEWVRLIVHQLHAQRQKHRVHDRLAQAHHHHMKNKNKNIMLPIGSTTFGIEIDGISKVESWLWAIHIEVKQKIRTDNNHIEINVTSGGMAEARAWGTIPRL